MLRYVCALITDFVWTATAACVQCQQRQLILQEILTDIQHCEQNICQHKHQQYTHKSCSMAVALHMQRQQHQSRQTCGTIPAQGAVSAIQLQARCRTCKPCSQASLSLQQQGKAAMPSQAGYCRYQSNTHQLKQLTLRLMQRLGQCSKYQVRLHSKCYTGTVCHKLSNLFGCK